MVDRVEEGTEAEEGAQDIKSDNHPDVVPWNEYVGVKESLGKKLDSANDKVASLEEQLSKAVKQDDFNAIKNELDKAKADLQKATDELKGIKEQSVTEKRSTLITKGIPEDEVKAMSEDALNAAIKVLERYKPKPDLGGGGGSGGLKGSPMELARQAYANSK